MSVATDSLYQTITLVLSDGRRFIYTGRVQIDPDEPLRVTSIEVTRPRPLPDGGSWVNNNDEVAR